MNKTTLQDPSRPEPCDTPVADAPSGKALWVEPTLTRMDIRQSQTVFNISSDGDSFS
tara:strand:- start:2500 stop:2670 length:171 start_codon:yes stop_codon:yes gene_type:complete